MLKSRATVRRLITDPITSLALATVPINKKWVVKQIRFYIADDIDWILDILVNDISRMLLLAGPYTNIYSVNDTLKAGDKIECLLRSRFPLDRVVGVYIQYDEIDI